MKAIIHHAPLTPKSTQSTGLFKRASEYTGTFSRKTKKQKAKLFAIAAGGCLGGKGQKHLALQGPLKAAALTDITVELPRKIILIVIPVLFAVVWSAVYAAIFCFWKQAPSGQQPHVIAMGAPRHPPRAVSSAVSSPRHLSLFIKEARSESARHQARPLRSLPDHPPPIVLAARAP